MDSEQISAANVNLDSNSSKTHRDENNSSFQVGKNNQIVKLQAEMNEIKTLLANLTQQVIFRKEEGNALRASSSRTQERVDTLPSNFCHVFTF